MNQEMSAGIAQTSNENGAVPHAENCQFMTIENEKC